MKKSKLADRILNFREFGLVIAIFALLAVASFVAPSFFSFSSVVSMLVNNSIYTILATGLMFVLISGGIDISVGATLALSGVIVSRIMILCPKMPVFVLILIGIIIGIVCGLINGVAITRLGAAPMIVTLATMYVFRGLAFVVTNGSSYFPHQFTEKFIGITQSRLLDVPVILLWVVIAAALSGFFLLLTKPGRRLYAVGTSESSSLISGIDTNRIKISAYMICGAFAGLSGVLYSSQYAMVNSDIGTGYEMTAIAICILGGVSITGGRGHVVGIIVSAILMGLINYLLSLLPGFGIWKNAVLGAIILIAVAVNLANGKLAEKRELKRKDELI